MPSHVDIPRLKEGKSGGAFWSVFAPCPKNGTDFTDANYAACMLVFFIPVDFHLFILIPCLHTDPGQR